MPSGHSTRCGTAGSRRGSLDVESFQANAGDGIGDFAACTPRHVVKLPASSAAPAGGPTREGTMPRVTQPLVERLAIVFDFDGTLAPDSISGFVDFCGLDVDRFWRERVHPRVEAGWDKMLAAFYALIEESARRPGAVNRDRLFAYGRQLELFPGVPEMFERLRRHARDHDPDIELEFYLITCGIADIARHTRIADTFRRLWGCEFHYHDDGRIAAVKRYISHTEKTRYLYLLAKGAEQTQEDQLSLAAYDDQQVQDLHVPLDQVIYVGDGSSDIPSFALMNEYRGIALGVYKGDEARNWESARAVGAGERVANLVPADFRDDSEMMRSLLLGVGQIAKHIALLKLSVEE